VSQRARNLCAVICLLWVGYAVVRIAAAAQGHPGDRPSLVLAVASGAVAAAGFGAYMLRRRRP
jgi:hypothetical protein